MATELEDLMEAVLAEPDSDAPRLVYADALQAKGDPRGELIVVQCELARLGCERTRLARWKAPMSSRDPAWLADVFAIGDPVHRAELRETERGLLREHGAAWTAGFPVPAACRIERGFIEHIDGASFRDPSRLFDRAPTMESLEIEVLVSGAELFAEPRTRQLRQLRLTVSPVPDHREVRRFLDTLEHVRQFAPVMSIEDAAERSRLEQQMFSPAFLPNLEAVELASTTHDMLVQLFAAAPGLRHLSLTGRGSELNWHELPDRLEILELEAPGVDLAAIVRSMPGLQALRVAFSHARGRDGADAIGDGLAALRVLDLTDSSLHPYAQGLFAGAGLSSLTVLRLRRCRFDDGRLGVLLRSPLIHRLRHLDLRNNPITDRSVEGLCDARNLHVLELDGTRLTTSGVATLRSRLPTTRLRGPIFQPWSK